MFSLSQVRSKPRMSSKLLGGAEVEREGGVLPGAATGAILMTAGWAGVMCGVPMTGMTVVRRDRSRGQCWHGGQGLSGYGGSEQRCVRGRDEHPTGEGLVCGPAAVHRAAWLALCVTTMVKRGTVGMGWGRACVIVTGVVTVEGCASTAFAVGGAAVVSRAAVERLGAGSTGCRAAGTSCSTGNRRKGRSDSMVMVLGEARVSALQGIHGRQSVVTCSPSFHCHGTDT
ncbi:hypothetical protein B0H17DRAFT_1145946 [Mycena rosella]|uniref:Uncharacterized protein n=1 Tax=Mycena rosella TaxID=1033263 RepID=A0AAD7CPU7_MYCRO|nr:hypothetical protein B0H17DRAFT_1145946 [Mycena rosella]